MSDSTPNWFTQLKSADPSQREWAVEQIVEANPENALELLLPLLSDENASVRETVAMSLGDIQNESVIPHLINTVRQDVDEEVKYAALQSLANYRHENILQVLIDVVYGEYSLLLRQAVAPQLGHYDSEKSVDTLIVLLEDEHLHVLNPAVDSLLKLNRPKLQEVWEKILLSCIHCYPCKVAAQGLADLKQLSMFDVIQPFLDSINPDVRKGAAFAFGCIDDQRGIAKLIELARSDSDELVRETALLALSAFKNPQIGRYLIDAIYNKQLSTRAKEIIAEQLSSYTSEDSVDALISLLDDEDDIVCTAALEALRQLNRPRLLPVWINALNKYADNPQKRWIIDWALRNLEGVPKS